MFGAEILLSCAPHVGYLSCQFALIYLMRAILNYLGAPEASESFVPGGLIAATALVFSGLMVSM